MRAAEASGKESTVVRLIAKADQKGADEIMIEYKDGHEEVFALAGNIGYGMDRVKSNTPE